MTRRPPAFAISLLEGLETDQGLVGDLVEEYAHGRTRLWFWKQTAGAVAQRPVLCWRAFRWLAALPAAMWATSRVPNAVMRLTWGQVSAAHNAQIPLAMSLVLMPLIFISSFAFVAPSRRGLVARMAFIVVCALGAALTMWMGTFSDPHSMDAAGLTAIGIFAGGLAGYLPWRSAPRRA